MAKKKSKKKSGLDNVSPRTWLLTEVGRKAPDLYDQAASLAPFDDVITSQWVDKDYVGIGIEAPTGVYPSGVFQTYGARIYEDKVIMFCDSDYADWVEDDDTPGPSREEYITDMPGLWSFLRQLPRPMHSFSKWSPF